MNIDQLPAGRELDALVAEKVMGWKFVSVAVDTETTKWCHHDATEPSEHDGLCEFSTHIAAAWEVVEKMSVPSVHKLNHYCELGHWRAETLDDIGHTVDAEADTAPLAICRAALKAVGA